jgi:NAD(P)-dependent dehydrogenase (short-subunit alcohol dehydrogenase family)
VPAEDFDLSGRGAVVTGASRGIGAEVARALDAAGARVALVARNEGALADVAAALANDPVVVTADLAGAAAPAHVAARAVAEMGTVDILVNNAAVAVRQPITDLEAATMDRLWAVNVRAPLLLIAALVPSMVAAGGGSIINVSSVSGVRGTPKRAAYAATKGAVDAATRSLAVELGPHGIRVNSVAPGVVDTDMWKSNKAIPGVVEEVSAHIALRRWSHPGDIAGVFVFLASDASRYVTGETLCADGGMAHTFDLYGGAV